MREIGSILDNKYEVEKRLGSGGMGEVYRVRHMHLDQERVIKILRADLASDPVALERFQQEARIATRVKHRNVAILYDFSRLQDGSFYMVWEYIEGIEVAEKLRQQGPLPLRFAIELAIQSLRGLAAIHAMGVIHRDISPDNLMLTEDMHGNTQIKIIDLGLAKAPRPEGSLEITQAGVFMGKLRYCSPEQAGPDGGAPLDHRTDIYSMSAVLYEMLTGMLPFESENLPGYIFKRLSEDPLPLIGRNPRVEIPPRMNEAVLRGLARSPEDRYPDAISYIKALVEIANELGPEETRPSASLGATVGAPRRRELSREERREILAQLGLAPAVKPEAKERPPTVAPRPGTPTGAGEAPARPQEAPPPEVAGEGAKAAPLQVFAPRREHPPEPRPKRRRAVDDPRVIEAEKLVERYIKERRSVPARMAFETLIDLAPTHPRRGDFESWVAFLDEERSEHQHAEELAAQGRNAAWAGDLDAARTALAELERVPGSTELARALSREISRSANEQRDQADVETAQMEIRTALAEGNLSLAQTLIDRLAALGTSHVTVDRYRRQLDEARWRTASRQTLQEFEEKFRIATSKGEWEAAQEIALELGREQPENPRSAEMFAEVVRRENLQRRREAADQGVAQVESFLAAGDLEQARLALKVLVQIDPKHPQRKVLEEKLKSS